MLKVFEMGFIGKHSLVSGKVSIECFVYFAGKKPQLAARYLAQLKLQTVALLLHLPSAVSDLGLDSNTRNLRLLLGSSFENINTGLTVL